MIEQPGTSADPSGTTPAGADQDAGSLSLKEAARQLGISERTIRRRIQDGSLEGYKQATEHGYEWRVCLGSIRADPSGMPTRHIADRPGSAPTPPARAEVPTSTPPEIMHALERALEMADRLQQEASANAEKIAELTGTAAHWQARALIAEDRVRLLMAPKDEPEPPSVPEPRRSWWRRLLG